MVANIGTAKAVSKTESLVDTAKKELVALDDTVEHLRAVLNIYMQPDAPACDQKEGPCKMPIDSILNTNLDEIINRTSCANIKIKKLIERII